MDETLLKKLKLDKFTDVAMMKPAQEEETAFDGYGFPTEVAEKLELGLAYVYSLEEMKNIILQASAQHLLVENGQLYLFYPKNKNKLGHAPIHRDHIFPYLEVTDEDGYVKGTAYKFNRMVALDDNYTMVAVKFQPETKVQSSSRSSARVGDYLDKVVDIEGFLEHHPKELSFYQSLTPGYQRDWARYVYSAKTEATQNKRLAEMVDILEQGYKTKQLYREGKK
ncbi:YdeI/OmpD-associated family protein [Streptococcus suis]